MLFLGQNHHSGYCRGQHKSWHQAPCGAILKQSGHQTASAGLPSAVEGQVAQQPLPLERITQGLEVPGAASAVPHCLTIGCVCLFSVYTRGPQFPHWHNEGVLWELRLHSAVLLINFDDIRSNKFQNATTRFAFRTPCLHCFLFS